MSLPHLQYSLWFLFPHLTKAGLQQKHSEKGTYNDLSYRTAYTYGRFSCVPLIWNEVILVEVGQ